MPALRRPLIRWLPALAIVLAVALALPLTGTTDHTDASPRSTGLSAEAPDDSAGTPFALPPAAPLLLAAMIVIGLALIIVAPSPRVTSVLRARLRAPPLRLGS